MSDKVPTRRLPTGVPGLDAVLGGVSPSVLLDEARFQALHASVLPVDPKPR